MEKDELINKLIVEKEVKNIKTREKEVIKKVEPSLSLKKVASTSTSKYNASFMSNPIGVGEDIDKKNNLNINKVNYGMNAGKEHNNAAGKNLRIADTAIAGSASGDNTEWRMVTKRRKKVSFTGVKQTALPTVQRKNLKWLFVSRFQQDVTQDQVLKFLKGEIVADYVVEKLTPKIQQANYASFKVGVPEDIFEQVMQPEFWPNNVFVNRFYFSSKLNKDFHRLPQTMPTT